MKNVVFLDDLKESDIRPGKMYNEYKELLAQDVNKYFSDPSLLVKVDCPGCLGKDFKAIFNKNGFNYCICNKCGSFFVSPRPAKEELNNFYKISHSGKFLRRTLLNSTLDSRSKNIFSYRLQWIIGLVEEYLPKAENFLDYNTRYPQFLRELSAANVFSSLVCVNQECYEAEDIIKSCVNVYPESGIDNNKVDMIAAFDIIERVFNPRDLFQYAAKVCCPGGLFVFTTTTSSGFEYKILGAHSPNIIVPDRMNILSLEALVDTLNREGFEVLEVSTPGRLDVEMVRKTLEDDPKIPVDDFWKYIFTRRGPEAIHALQEYLQQFQLSAHARIAAKKR